VEIFCVFFSSLELPGLVNYFLLVLRLHVFLLCFSFLLYCGCCWFFGFVCGVFGCVVILIVCNVIWLFVVLVSWVVIGLYFLWFWFFFFCFFLCWFVCFF